MALLLSDQWEMARAAPDLACDPADLPATLDWIPAPVPGTAATALRQAGLWDGQSPLELDQSDIWYRAKTELQGRFLLRCHGLATLAQLFVDGEQVLASSNMFRPVETEAVLRGGVVHIRFRSLLKSLEGKRGRPRWRPRLIVPASLRSARTTLLGHMPGWCPSVHAVGPWRGVDCIPLDGAPQLIESVVRARLLPDGGGQVMARLRASHGDTPALRVDGRLLGDAVLPHVPLWWPHTHGKQDRLPVEAVLDGQIIPLGAVGFRHIAVDRGADGAGFGLRVNDVPVFCRGACWVTPDLAGLPTDRAAFRPGLLQARDAGMNMLRLPGVGLYEADAFYDLCDELGLLVWQDAAFANFDYPTDAAFLDDAAAEIRAFLDRTSARACLAVFCGGSEVAQQAAMLGVPAADRTHPLFDRVIPECVASHRPDIVHVAHSPDGPDLPFLPGSGIAHYYGVGAYQRPLADARLAGPRFASECLAFSNVPEEDSIARILGVWQTHDPRWKAGVPRDAGASWDFEDVRDHYLRLLTEEDPAQLRYTDPDRYLDLSRAVVAELIDSVLSEWRRPGSGCAGGLVWIFQDPRPGAGWGMIDSGGTPKSAWHGFRRAAQPVHVSITDEGLNGLAFHLLNEAPAPRDVRLQITCLAQGRVPMAAAEHDAYLPARAGISLSSAALLNNFFDITYAYRFGPPAHDVTVARLWESGTLLAESFHFPKALARPRQDLGLRSRLERDAGDGGWVLILTTDCVAQSIHLHDRYFQPDRAWFHMAPGHEYRIRLHGSADATPAGDVLALNALSVHRYGVN